MTSAKTALRNWQRKIFEKKVYMYAAAIILLIINITLIVLMYRHNGYIF